MNFEQDKEIIFLWKILVQKLFYFQNYKYVTVCGRPTVATILVKVILS